MSWTPFQLLTKPRPYKCSSITSPHLADLMPHLVVRHDTKSGEALVVARQLQLPGEVLVEEVVLETVEAEQLRAVGHRPPWQTGRATAHERRRAVLEISLVKTHVLRAFVQTQQQRENRTDRNGKRTLTKLEKSIPCSTKIYLIPVPGSAYMNINACRHRDFRRTNTAIIFIFKWFLLVGTYSSSTEGVSFYFRVVGSQPCDHGLLFQVHDYTPMG